MSNWYHWNDKMQRGADFSELLGLTLDEVVNHDNRVIEFKTECGRTFQMYHEQDCCESVYVEDIVGDLYDLIGEPILLAEESSNKKWIDWNSETYTYYKLATINGYVDIRWFGTSNCYYNERVDFFEVRNVEVDDGY